MFQDHCVVCQKPTNKFCSACSTVKVYYCTAQCQLIDWPNHELICEKKNSVPSYPPGFPPKNGNYNEMIAINHPDQDYVPNPFFSSLDLIEAGGFRPRPLVYLKSCYFSPRAESSLKLPEFCSRNLEKIDASQAEELINQLVAHITPGLMDLHRSGDIDRLKSTFAMRYYDLQMNPFLFCFKIHSHQDMIEMLQNLVWGYYIDPLVPSKFGKSFKSGHDSSFLFACPKTNHMDELYNFTQKRIHSVGKTMNDVICVIDFDYVSESGNCRLTSILYFSSHYTTATQTFLRSN